MLHDAGDGFQCVHAMTLPLTNVVEARLDCCRNVGNGLEARGALAVDGAHRDGLCSHITGAPQLSIVQSSKQSAPQGTCNIGVKHLAERAVTVENLPTGGDCFNLQGLTWETSKEGGHAALVGPLGSWCEHRADHYVANLIWANPHLLHHSLCSRTTGTGPAGLGPRASRRRPASASGRASGSFLFYHAQQPALTLKTGASRSSGNVSLKPPRLALQMAVR